MDQGVNTVNPEDQAAEEADVNQPGAFEQQEQEEQVGFAVHAEPFAQADAGRDEQATAARPAGGQVDPGEIHPGSRAADA